MLNVVTIGGGTGSFHLLLGLKKLDDVKISAIVSMSDNGGSTGKLITMYGLLPPGDIRNCLVALSDDTEIWTKLFNYRFDEKLQKHSLGNLILTALYHICGSFEEGLKKAHGILGVEKHEVIPVTYTRTHLVAKMSNGEIIRGETQIRDYAEKNNVSIKSIFLEPIDDKAIIPNPKAIESIRNADFIILGPGSLYTSILPNLLVPDIADEINKSKAKKVFIVNIMTEPGETDNYTVEDFVKAMEKYISLDYILINSKMPSKSILRDYEKENKKLVKSNRDDERYVFADLLNEKDVLRHDPIKLKRVLHWLFLKNK